MTEKRQVFFSFHYARDSWRTCQVRNIGAITGDATISDNDWEEIKRGGDNAIKKWIDEQLKMRSCTVVLIGQETASRKWIDYEIKKSWELGKGVVGICIHNLKNAAGEQASKGENPFAKFEINGKSAAHIIKTYCNADYDISTDVYDNIKNNISDWVEEAIEIRKSYPKDSILEPADQKKRINEIGHAFSRALSAGALGIGAGGIITTVTEGTGYPTKYFGSSK